MDVHELLEHDLGHSQVDDLDTAPPLALLTMLSQRSGIELDRLRSMSLAGWVPWLLDSLDDSVPAALETYAFQLRGAAAEAHPQGAIHHELACLAAQPDDSSGLSALSERSNESSCATRWKLPLMLSCPLHGCWLESYWGVPGRYLQLGESPMLRRALPMTQSPAWTGAPGRR
jgi:hypothetical protein